jgi:putative membrane protein insertion efficiency factor
MIRGLFSVMLVFFVRLYQYGVAPLFPPSCRHTPSCSDYMIQAIRKWGPGGGLKLGLKRLVRCHPWGAGGHDPVPEKSGGKSREP